VGSISPISIYWIAISTCNYTELPLIQDFHCTPPIITLSEYSQVFNALRTSLVDGYLRTFHSDCRLGTKMHSLFYLEHVVYEFRCSGNSSTIRCIAIASPQLLPRCITRCCLETVFYCCAIARIRGLQYPGFQATGHNIYKLDVL
jgi:hypothetical protein